MRGWDLIWQPISWICLSALIHFLTSGILDFWLVGIQCSVLFMYLDFFLPSVLHLMKMFSYVFLNHFCPGAFWESSRLAASGLICERRLISVDMKNSYLFLLCYDTVLLLWMERLIVTTDYMKPEPNCNETCFAFSMWTFESFLLCTLLPSNQFYKLHWVH